MHGPQSWEITGSLSNMGSEVHGFGLTLSDLN